MPKYRLTLTLDDREDIIMVYNSTKEIARDLNISLSKLYQLMKNREKYFKNDNENLKYISISKIKNDLFND
jgi:predicted DNA-binding protein YlxM (UPF0122 family)